MSLPVSPLAPGSFPRLPEVKGVQTAIHAGGIRKGNRPDLFLASMAPGTVTAATFTRSLCPAAPIDWCRTLLNEGSGEGRALVCNSGNANAFTGKQGQASTELMAEAIAFSLGLEASEVFVASTGVIGEPMPDATLKTALPELADKLAPSSAPGWEEAAFAIRTTDTFSKGIGLRIEGSDASVVGIGKGSGMIAPDMATMLGFIFTDLSISQNLLQEALSTSVSKSFNRITVDSDSSTNDAVMLFATGKAGNDPITHDADPTLAQFQNALDDVTLGLAHQIVRDGEGATKFVEVTVSGAVTEESAEIIGKAIANSPLVKTALAAEDANWGRIVMAVGKAGQPADRDALAIWIGPELVAASGAVVDTYSEAAATRHLEGDEIRLRVDVGVGDCSATVWTCDLTNGYIDINAGYRT